MATSTSIASPADGSHAVPAARAPSAPQILVTQETSPAVPPASPPVPELPPPFPSMELPSPPADAAPAPLSPAEINALALENQAALIAYARSLVRDEQAALDIVQDTFLRLCRNPPDATRAKFWLFRVCRTRAIDWWRTRREQTVSVPAANVASGSGGVEDFFANLPDESVPLPGSTLQADEELDAIMLHVARLPARQRELVRLKFQAGLSYKEIAAATGLTVTNVGFILHNAIKTLRTALVRAA